MGDDIAKIVTAFFGGVILVAIVAVIVGNRSQAPAAITDIGTVVSKVVSAAVNPVSANYGYGSGSSTATTPSLSFSNELQSFSGLLGSVTPGSFK